MCFVFLFFIYRYFKGIAGVRGQEGELFGITNLLKFNDSVVTTNSTVLPSAAKEIKALFFFKKKYVSVLWLIDIIKRTERLEKCFTPADNQTTRFRIEQNRQHNNNIADLQQSAYSLLPLSLSLSLAALHQI